MKDKLIWPLLHYVGYYELPYDLPYYENPELRNNGRPSKVIIYNKEVKLSWHEGSIPGVVNVTGFEKSSKLHLYNLTIDSDEFDLPIQGCISCLDFLKILPFFRNGTAKTELVVARRGPVYIFEMKQSV